METNLIRRSDVVRSCLYIADRGTEKYEPYGSIPDIKLGICDICDCWISCIASEFKPERTDWVRVDVYSDHSGTTAAEKIKFRQFV